VDPDLLNSESDLAFKVNLDLDPGFDEQKLKKKYS
jgi:hypothetical protein